MGCVYQPRWTKAGELHVTRVWWLKYRDATGRVVREASGTEKKREAEKLLARRTGAAAEGRSVNPRAERTTVGELLEDLKNEYQANARRIDRLENSLAHLIPVFAARRSAQVTTADVTAYVVARQGEGAANATVNRELAALKRAFTLAMRSSPPKVHARPYIPMLKEDNAREGFFEREQFEAVRKRLPEDLRGLVTFAYVTGWRVPSEILTLQWRQVDLKAATVRLEPGTTKNKEGRMFYLTPELRATLEAQRASTEAFQRRQGVIIPWVFHRAGRPIKNFRKAWNAACDKAGCPGRIPHDFRRSAIRNLERAGVPRSAAMKMVGHKTEAVYRRYAIVDEAMMRESSAKLALLETGREVVQDQVQAAESPQRRSS
jgi:integrase